jgi:hypothetical protein
MLPALYMLAVWPSTQHSTQLKAQHSTVHSTAHNTAHNIENRIAQLRATLTCICTGAKLPVLYTLTVWPSTAVT